MSYSAGEAAYKLAYELAPLTLIGGIAGAIPGGSMSIMSLMEGMSFGGLLGGGSGDFDEAFANFYPIAGSTLVENQYGQYPFANLTVAANAVVAQPLSVSLLMRFPARGIGGYGNKTAVLTSLQQTLAAHTQSGGWFAVATPAFLYTNALLLRLHDVSGQDSKQAQIEYQWDFFQPLITLDQALGAQNSMMSALSSGGQTDGATSGVGNAVGDPTSTAGPEISPASTGNIGSGVGVSGAGVPALGYNSSFGAGIG